MRSIIAWLGARVIYALIWIFGRTHRRDDLAWLMGPMGNEVIGDGEVKCTGWFRTLASANDRATSRGST